MAGSQIPQIVAESFVELGIKPQNVYGMTENSSHQYTHPADNKEIWIQTCGRGGRAYEVKIFDTEDLNQPASVGQVGQIGGRGAALMLGYFANQEATSASFNDQGWFLSGDLGSLDAKGNLRIEGRLKDLIIRGGHNIYPTQIEDYALRHEDIKNAAAFGVPDDRLGERVCLAIQGTPEPEQVLHLLADQGLSIYDMPEFFLRLEEFPLTASGKIRKQTLVQMVKRGTLAPEPVRYSPAKEVN
jgi:acyl-CoA synthetase